MPDGSAIRDRLSGIPAHLAVRWFDLQDRLWFIPTLMTVASAILALVMVQVDRALVRDQRPESDWIFGAGASGAREVLSAVASTTITITGLVFSITIVALQLASSQFTPRVLRTFTGDRGNQLVLGAFIATFTYALLVLRTVRDSTDADAAFVPSVSVTVALLLTAVSVGFLIFFISHAADSIRASVVIDRATQDALGVIRKQYPEPDEDPAARPEPARAAVAMSAGIVATASGFVQAVHHQRLFAAIGPDDLSLELTTYVGDFVLEGAVIARVQGADTVDEELSGAVNAALTLGRERTMRADVELGIRQLADIAVKALSPGINDPTTATICIDRLAELLVAIARRPEMPSVRRGPEGRGTLYAPTLTWETTVRSAYDEIRHFGAGDPLVAEHLSRTLARLTTVVSPRRRPVLDSQRQALIHATRRDLSDSADVAAVEQAGAEPVRAKAH